MYRAVETIIDLQAVYVLTTESLATLGGVFVMVKSEECKWTGRDLNPRPPACKAGDLPLIYRPLTNPGTDRNSIDVQILCVLEQS